VYGYNFGYFHLFRYYVSVTLPVYDMRNGFNNMFNRKLSNLVDILSWPQLNFGFNLVATDMTSDGDTGSINKLQTTGLDMYGEKHLFEFRTLWLAMTSILEKKLLKPSAAS